MTDEHTESRATLLPCPFCGGAPSHHRFDNGRAFIMCADCGCDIDTLNADGDVRNVWNRRTAAEACATEAGAQAMSDRPDYIKCIADMFGVAKGASPAKAWCGRPVFGFYFMDIDHAAMNGRKRAYLVACSDCAREVVAGLMNGVEAEEPKP